MRRLLLALPFALLPLAAAQATNTNTRSTAASAPMSTAWRG